MVMVSTNGRAGRVLLGIAWRRKNMGSFEVRGGQGEKKKGSRGGRGGEEKEAREAERTGGSQFPTHLFTEDNLKASSFHWMADPAGATVGPKEFSCTLRVISAPGDPFPRSNLLLILPAILNAHG